MKENISKTVRDMQVGEEKVFPLERFSSVKVIVSNIGLVKQRRYRTTTNRDLRLIAVTRIN